MNNLFNEQKNAEDMLHMADEMLQEDPGISTKDEKASWGNIVYERTGRKY